jgi:predicted nuclease of predicted toxin-antitoxin system
VRFKLDENLDTRLAMCLVDDGHDVATVRSEGLSGSADELVFAAATDEGRTLVTLDLDFANPFRFRVAGTAGIVVLRPGRPLLALIEATLQSVRPFLRDDEVHGKLWIVEPGRIREHRPWTDE